MQVDLFAPVELKDIRRDLNHWKGTADSMARNYPKHQYAVVEDIHGSYVCMPITAKFEWVIIYQTGGGNAFSNLLECEGGASMRQVSKQASLFREIIVDNFAGGGGASAGISIR